MAYYMIVSRLTGFVLDVEKGRDDAGTRVRPWKRKDKEQQWWYDDVATGTIRTKINGFCLDIEEGGLRIMPYQPGDQNQQWERDFQNGYIRNRVNRNHVLDIHNQDTEKGARIIACDANGGASQMWNFEGPGAIPVAQPHAQPVVQQRREFHILSELNGKCLDIKGGNGAAGTPAIMWSKNSPPSKNQLWYIDQSGLIRSALNEFALDAHNGDMVHMQSFNGSANQQWVIEGNTIRNRSSGEVLDIARGNNDNGAQVCSWKYHGNKNQQWRIEYI